MDRDRLEFSSFFDSGMDWETGICDGQGSDVFERDDNGDLHFIGRLYGYLPGDVSNMTDEELDEAFVTALILSNL